MKIRLNRVIFSIKENGVIQPLIVIEKGRKFELIAGERRLRASKLAGLRVRTSNCSKNY